MTNHRTSEVDVSHPTQKACVRCGELKALDDFHRRAKAADGRNPACKACICAARREYVKSNPDRERAYRKKRWADPDSRAIDQERIRAWRAGNADRQREYQRQYEQANAERAAERKRAWYLANRDVILERDRSRPESRRERQERYRKRNRELLTERQRRRRVDRLGLKMDDVDVDALWTGVCGICGLSMDWNLAHPDPMSKSIDHIRPLVAGGTHEASNLQWAHLRCNLIKGASVPD